MTKVTQGRIVLFRPSKENDVHTYHLNGQDTLPAIVTQVNEDESVTLAVFSAAKGLITLQGIPKVGTYEGDGDGWEWPGILAAVERGAESLERAVEKAFKRDAKQGEALVSEKVLSVEADVSTDVKVDESEVKAEAAKVVDAAVSDVKSDVKAAETDIEKKV